MLELNRIYHEPNQDTISRMPDLFVDYVITSPPYNIASTSNLFDKNYDSDDDSMTEEEYYKSQFDLITGLLRTTKNHVIYNIQMLSGNKRTLFRLMGDFADKIKEVIIWNKGFGAPAMSEKVFNSAFEFIIIFSNNYPNKRYFDDAIFERGTQSNLYRIKNKHSNKYAEFHKAVMPLDIPRYFMQIFGKEGDIWYDPYFGTGTTGIAAIMEKKNWIGSEKSKLYVDISTERIKNHADQLVLF